MNSLLRAFTLTRRSPRIIVWIYGINLLLSLLILLPAYTTLGAGMGRSMAFTNLLDGFDYTVFSDFMKNSGDAVSGLMAVGRWLGMLWLISSVFLSGGMLLRFSQPDQPVQASAFLAGCARYFGRFMGLLGVIALFFGVLFAIIGLIGTLIGAALYNSVTEQVLFYVGLVTVAIALLISALVFCIGDYAKVMLFRQDDHNAFRAFGRAGRLVLTNPGRTFWPLFAAHCSRDGFVRVVFSDRRPDRDAQLAHYYPPLSDSTGIYCRPDFLKSMEFRYGLHHLDYADKANTTPSGRYSQSVYDTHRSYYPRHTPCG